MTSIKYKLLDCGNGKKVEQFGEYKLIRPCPQALWKPFNEGLWQEAEAEFIVEKGEKGYWKNSTKNKLPKNWVVESPDKLRWNIEPNEFGNVAIFTEHWTYMEEILPIIVEEEEEFQKHNKKYKILNLFTYSGSNCLGLAREEMKVTAVDSAKSAITNYNKNLELNDISKDGQRFILEDVFKFIDREVRRKSKYNVVMVDAPSYGKGGKGEIFKIEDDLVRLIRTCKRLMAKDGKLILTLHSPRFTLTMLEVLLTQMFPENKITTREIVQTCESGARLPSGILVTVI